MKFHKYSQFFEIELKYSTGCAGAPIFGSKVNGSSTSYAPAMKADHAYQNTVASSKCIGGAKLITNIDSDVQEYTCVSPDWSTGRYFLKKKRGLVRILNHLKLSKESIV